MNVRLQKGSVTSSNPEMHEDVRTVVICDDHKQPLIVVQSTAPGKIIMTRRTDQQFDEITSQLGINLNKSTIVQRKEL